MNIFRSHRVKNFVVTGLIICLIFWSTSVFASEKEACDKAFVKCGVDALIGGFLSGPQMFLFIYSGCLMGYTWCLKYYMQAN
jgi:hypothetical protein